MKMCESIAQGGIQKHEESGDLEGKGERAEGRRHRKRGCWVLLPPDIDLFELNKYVKRILVFWYIFKTFYFWNKLPSRIAQVVNILLCFITLFSLYISFFTRSESCRYVVPLPLSTCVYFLKTRMFSYIKIRKLILVQCHYQIQQFSKRSLRSSLEELRFPPIFIIIYRQYLTFSFLFFQECTMGFSEASW